MKQMGDSGNANVVNVNYKDKAENLLNLSHALAISSFASFSKKYPFLNQYISSKQLNDWNFFMAVAGVSAAIIVLDDGVSEDALKKFMWALKEALNKWNGDGWRSFEDLSRFITRQRKDGIDDPVALGLWVLWNVRGKKPSNEEIDITPVIGLYLLNSFRNWWREVN